MFASIDGVVLGMENAARGQIIIELVDTIEYNYFMNIQFGRFEN